MDDSAAARDNAAAPEMLIAPSIQTDGIALMLLNINVNHARQQFYIDVGSPQLQIDQLAATVFAVTLLDLAPCLFSGFIQTQSVVLYRDYGIKADILMLA